MNDEDDPFMRKRRSKKPTKRRRRPERVTSIDDSDSDAPNSYFSQKASVTTAKCRPSTPTARRPKVFGMPIDVQDVQKEESSVKEKDEARPDYSEAGLQRLRELTFSKPPTPPPPPPDEPKPYEGDSDITMQALPPPRQPGEIPQPPRAPFTRTSTAAPTIRRVAKTPVIDADDPAAGFVSRQRERTELKLGVMNGDDIEVMELEHDEGDASGADDWEREQLRRVGIAVGVGGDSENVDARAIIEEEDLSLAKVANGEVGLSHLDTFLEAVEEAASSAATEIKSYENKRSELLSTRREHEAIEAGLQKKVKMAESRQAFYKELNQFADEMGDALADVHERINRRHAARMRKLEAEIEKENSKMQTGTDEFGRTVDPTQLVRRRLHDDEAEDSSSEDDVYHDDVMSEVPPEYATVPRVAARFKDWSARYANDYANAQGDRLVGDAVGWVVKGTSRPVTDLQWLKLVPANAQSQALTSAGIVLLAGLVLRSKWNLYSAKSTRKYAAMMRSALRCLKDGAAARLLDAIAHRVRDEVHLLARCDAVVAQQAKQCISANIAWMCDMCLADDDRVTSVNAVAEIRALVSPHA